MEQIKHSEMVAALVKSGNVIAQEMNGHDASLMHMAIGVSGEAGELLDAIKKKIIYRKELDRENVIEELGDLEFFMEGLRRELGVSREECIQANISKLSERYKGLRYTDEAAQERADKKDEGKMKEPTCDPALGGGAGSTCSACFVIVIGGLEIRVAVDGEGGGEVALRPSPGAGPINRKVVVMDAESMGKFLGPFSQAWQLRSACVPRQRADRKTQAPTHR